VVENEDEEVELMRAVAGGDAAHERLKQAAAADASGGAGAGDSDGGGGGTGARVAISPSPGVIPQRAARHYTFTKDHKKVVVTKTSAKPSKVRRCSRLLDSINTRIIESACEFSA